MKHKLKIVVLGLLVLLMARNVVYSQISFGGMPPSFKSNTTLPKIDTVDVDFNVEMLKSANIESEELTNDPPCIAKAIPVYYTMENSGTWKTLSNGNEMWQLRLQAKDALAIILSYYDFYIPECGKLYIYNADKSMVLGAYTKATHPDGGFFSTEMIAGDDVIMEYVSTKTRKEIEQNNDFDSMPIITVDNIGYVFDKVVVRRFPKNSDVTTEIGESSDCMININCSEGDDWQVEKKGVCQMSMFVSNGGSGAGWYVCSGTLINNTSFDLTPYVLSAFHCYEGSTESDLSRWLFTFGYEAPGCKDATPVETHTITGCYLRAATPIDGASDGLLIELAEDIPEDWDVYFNGWDRTNEEVAGGGVIIHHPAGDIKKISTFESYHESTWPGEKNGAANAHWLLTFVATENGYSVTEGGSSGGPMFNSNHLVKGTLTGGNSSCSLLDGTNYYGKLWYHWDQYGDNSETQMKAWLDPLNLGVQQLEGTALNPSTPRIVCEYSEIELGSSTEMNVPGSVKTAFVIGRNLTDSIVSVVEGPFEISSDSLNWNSEVKLPKDGGRLYVRFVPQSIGQLQGKITCSNALVTSLNIDLTASSCPEIVFDMDELPSPTIYQEYEVQPSVSNNTTETVAYEIIDGTLPLGIDIDSETGQIYGAPSEAGIFNFSLMVKDENGCSAIKDYELNVLCDVRRSFPYIESFELGFPSCWDIDYDNGELDWKLQTGGDTGGQYPELAFDGTYNMIFRSEDYDSSSTFLVTPQLGLASLENPVLTFSHTQAYWVEDRDVLEVFYKTSSADEWKPIVVYSEDIQDWQTEHIALPEPSDEYQIGFKATANFGHGVTLDNVIISSPSLNVTPKVLYLSDFINDGDQFISEIQVSGIDLNEDITLNSNGPFALSNDKINWADTCLVGNPGGIVYVRYNTSDEELDNTYEIEARSTATTDTLVIFKINTGIGDLPDEMGKITAVNPFTNELKLMWNGEIDQVRVTNISGITVYRSNKLHGKRELIIPSSSWPAGVYCVQAFGTVPQILKVVRR